ncbi:MAG: GNAT family N-acetyltransferase [Bacteroidota bacterium]
MKTFPTLTTERLILRQIHAEDKPYVFQGLSHPDVIKYYGVSYQSLEDSQEQMDWYANLEKRGEGIFWAVCDKETATFYGTGGIYDISQEHKKAEIGFWLLPDHWGKGILKESFAAIEQYVFGTLGLHRIEGFVETGNRNCIRAMGKVGYQLEGTMKDAEVKKGQYISLHIFAKIHG